MLENKDLFLLILLAWCGGGLWWICRQGGLLAGVAWIALWVVVLAIAA